jgi:hypothetical protein
MNDNIANEERVLRLICEELQILPSMIAILVYEQCYVDVLKIMDTHDFESVLQISALDAQRLFDKITARFFKVSCNLSGARIIVELYFPIRPTGT